MRSAGTTWLKVQSIQPSSSGGGGAVTLNSWQCNAHSSNLNIWNGGVGGWQQGDWIPFNGVNLSGKSRVNLNYASTGSGQYKVTVDSYSGTQICNIGFGSTGGWNNYSNASNGMSNNPGGSHNIWIIDNGSTPANIGTITIQ